MLRNSRLISLSFALLLIVFISVVIAPSIGHAAPTAIRTTPLDGEILQRTPTAVGVGFDEPLNQEASTLRILTVDGNEITIANIAWSSDASSVTMTLPRDFADGVYTLVWHAVSARDGESNDGWSSFSIGNPQDATIVTIPTSSTGNQVPPAWMQIAARFLALAGVLISISIWPMWRGIIRPALSVNTADIRGTTRLMQRWAFVALALGWIGSFLELAVHSRVLHDARFIDGIMQTLGHDEWGFWWTVRVMVLTMMAIGLAIAPWWYYARSHISDWSLWLLSFVLPIPLVLSGHAVKDVVGRTGTLVITYLNLLALAFVVGGSIWLALSLRHLRFSLNSSAEQSLRKRSLWFAVVAGGTLILTSIYLGSIHAGNLQAITGTSFGHMLIAHIMLGGGACVVAFILLTRSLARPAAPLLSLLLAAIMIISIVPVAGMDVYPPARTELTERSVQTRQSLSFDGRQGIFLVAPGRVGVNHWRLETPGTYFQTETNVFVDISSPDYPEIGTKTVQMYRVQGNAFEHHGTEFSLVGNWDIGVRIEEPGFPPSIANFSQHFDTENAIVDLPGSPWKLNTLAGLAGSALALAGVIGIATAVAANKRDPLRKEAGGLAAVALILAAVVLLQGRIDPLLVVENGEGAINANDLIMVARGKETYANYCASCHGEGLRGDGPLAPALIPPPADFSAPHTRVHSNEDYIYWIQYGIQGTAMPGFRQQLSDQDIRDVIAYIQYWQKDDGASDAGATPEPRLGVCDVAPMEFADLQGQFAHGLHPETRRGTPLVRAADSTVSPERTNEIMWTLEQLVNCANTDQFLSRVPLFTRAMLQDIFPQGMSWEVTSRATAQPNPVEPQEAITIQDVQSVNLLADGRVAVTVIFNDPAAIGVIPGAAPVYQVTLVLINEDGVWLIDEIR